mmetsp:Transcript_45000/g.108823  ORF Transcript_45000/g.108823 Transcript_45000/m.108823 type:complete len:584 (-) Transcript_45000:370-2121(-)
MTYRSHPRTMSSLSWVFCGLVVMSRFATIADATTGDSSITTVTAHPGMFGIRWTEVVTAEIKLVTADLCQEPSSIISDNANRTENNNQGIALYYDPTKKTGEPLCKYASMTQVAQAIYPEAQYLLFARDRMEPIGSAYDIPNPNLSVAVVSFEDGQAIERAISSNLNETTDGYSMRIDAVSRAIFDDSGVIADSIRLWVVLTRISSALSIVGSIYVLVNLVGTKQRRKDNLQSLFNRQLLAISTSDVISSIAIFVGSWATPSSPPGNFEGYYSQRRWDLLYPAAIGTEATCSAAGFFLHMGILSSAFFTGFFAIQALLVVRYSWKEDKMGRLEIFFMAIGIGFPFITALYATLTRLMNPMSTGFCFINSNPPECFLWETGAVFDEYCETAQSGDGHLIYQVVLATGWVFFNIVVIIYSMTSLYLFVRKQERQGAWWIYNNQNRRLEKKVLAKAIMYISVHLVIWIPTFLSILGQQLLDGLDWANALLCMFLPLQGGFNALIYSGIFEKCLEKVFCCFGGEDKAITSRRASMQGIAPMGAISMGIGSSDEISPVPALDDSGRDLNKFSAPNSIVVAFESKAESC